MKTGAKFLAVLLILPALAFADTDANTAEDAESPGEKVEVCHKGKTLSLPKAAAEAHLKHGDASGPCADSSKVTVCHKGKTLTLPKTAAEAHLKHGDTPGPCLDEKVQPKTTGRDSLSIGKKSHNAKQGNKDKEKGQSKGHNKNK